MKCYINNQPHQCTLQLVDFFFFSICVNHNFLDPSLFVVWPTVQTLNTDPEQETNDWTETEISRIVIKMVRYFFFLDCIFNLLTKNFKANGEFGWDLDFGVALTSPPHGIDLSSFSFPPFLCSLDLYFKYLFKAIIALEGNQCLSLLPEYS